MGRRVCGLLAADDDIEEVIAIDREPMAPIDGRVTTHQVHLRDVDIDRLFAGVDVVCHLAGSDPLEPAALDHDLHTTTRVLDSARRCNVAQVIVRTTAAVYGARPDNPVPLPETAAIRPDAETAWVRVRGQIEDQVAGFASVNPDIAVAVLRPCVTVSPDGPDALGRVLAAARVVAATDGAPPQQFVHADDVAAAVDVVRRAGAEGIYNVAPDGALDPEMIRALVGGSPRLPLPEAVARRLTALGWRYKVAPTPPGFLSYVTHPWVVGNDRLRGLGWIPTHSNEEAFVAGHAAAPWASVTPQRRQELALGAAAVVVVGAIAGAAALVRRQLR